MAPPVRACPNCQALVHDSEEFCPTCGEWMGLDEPGDDAFDLQGGPPEDETYIPDGRAVTIRCPLCGSENPSNNRHCEQCGARLGTGPLPVAPQPIIQTTAAMRTAIIAAGALIAVIVIAFVVNAIRGDGTTEETVAVDTTPQTTQPDVPTGPVVIFSADCSDAYADRPCEALFDQLAETDWNAALPTDPESPLTITLTFDQPYAIEFLEFTNLEAESDRFIRNARPNGLRITASDVATPQAASLEDRGGVLPPVPFNTSLSTSITIEIVSYHPGQPTGEGEDVHPPFDDLSIAEIRVFGKPSS